MTTPAAAAEILAIIPAYRHPEQLERCLAALATSTVPVTPCVQDNNRRNLGFTKACNIGLRESLRRGHRFALLLNQDCYIERDTIASLITFMDEHPRCALAGPMQVSAEQPEHILNAGGVSAYPFGRHRAATDRSAYPQSETVSWVNGACVFVRMEAVIEFGLLDEGMFLIGSDSDWCFTARQRGWEVWYVADARVHHEGGVTHSMSNLDTQRILFRDMDYWRRKWVGTVMHRQLDRPIGVPRITAPIPAALHQALDQQRSGNVLDAEIAYRDVLEVDQTNVDALNLLGVILMHHGLVVCGLELFDKALQLAPHIAQFHANRAAALSQLQGRLEDAVAEFNAAVRLEDNSVDLLENIAKDLTQLGFPDAAAAARAKASRLRR